MAEEITAASAPIDKVLEQAFANAHTGRMHASQRLQDANDNVSEQTKVGFLEMKEKVGMREAAAIQRMDTSKIAQEILQARATANQPPSNG